MKDAFISLILSGSTIFVSVFPDTHKFMEYVCPMAMEMVTIALLLAVLEHILILTRKDVCPALKDASVVTVATPVNNAYRNSITMLQLSDVLSIVAMVRGLSLSVMMATMMMEMDAVWIVK